MYNNIRTCYLGNENQYGEEKKNSIDKLRGLILDEHLV